MKQHLNNMTILNKPFYFVRHGETDWNRRHLYMGSQDIPLNQRGIEQSKLAADWLKDEPIVHIATSPLSRARKTAEIIAEKIQKPITVVDDLRECGWGIKEGEPFDDGVILQKWFKGEALEGAEKVHDFGARVMRGLTSALELPGPVLIVAHGGVYCAIQRVFGWPFINVKNCSPLYHKPPEESQQSWFVSDLSSSIIT